ncbi:MAG: hypothetical protein JNL60_15360 [Bacteroidia bacterium]|nr:hypothetical protein [Bacteroidia bacterium]
MCRIESEIVKVTDYEALYNALHSGKSYDYIYLATHGREISFGNISGTLDITWLQFAALVCHGEVSKPGCIFLHSCCRGGNEKVAWDMFACCEKIEFVCGPRQKLLPVELVMAFNIFLFNVEVRRTDPVRAAEKVLDATDTRLVCYDRADSTVGHELLSPFKSNTKWH